MLGQSFLDSLHTPYLWWVPCLLLRSWLVPRHVLVGRVLALSRLMTESVYHQSQHLFTYIPFDHIWVGFGPRLVVDSALPVGGQQVV